MSDETNGCEAIQETVVEWLSRPMTAVAAPLSAAAAAHVLVCDSCREFAEQAAMIATLVRTDPSPVPPARTWDDLGAAVERAVRPAAAPPRRRIVVRSLVFTAAAAAVTIALVSSDVRRAPIATSATSDPVGAVSAGVRELMPQVSATLVDYSEGMRDDTTFDRVFDRGIGR